jgi:hydroxysqualene synthase
MNDLNKSLLKAKEYCRQIANNHYENFPVASVLFPKKIRQDICNIYAFARTADDIADNVSLSKDQKIREISHFENCLNQNENTDPIFIALADTFKCYPHLNKKHFFDLLTAFKQDINEQDYDSLEELNLYARHSASPVGRIMLELFNENSDEKNKLSDLMCNGLQFINFWQDLSVDKKINRFYVPKKLLAKHNMTIEDFYFTEHNNTQNTIISELIEWTEKPYLESKRLINLIKNKRLKLELFFIWHGGNLMLKEIKRMNYLLLRERPSIHSYKIVKYLFSKK